jgi:hypothetical protein
MQVPRLPVFLAVLPALAAAGGPAAAEGTLAEMGAIRLRVREKGRDPPLPARIHLRDPRGEPVRAPGLPFFHDHFSCEGDVRIELAAGGYDYTVARGPEYREASGRVEVAAGSTAEVEVELERWIDLSARGWWSGVTHVHRPIEHVVLLMRSEDLHACTVLTQWNQQNSWRERPLPADLVVAPEPGRAYHLLASEDERGGGALLYHNLIKPLTLAGDRREFPSPLLHFTEALAQPGTRVEVEKPFWWDMPAWVATGKIHVIGLANNHMCRGRMLENEAWGRPRDAVRLPAPRGNGFYTQELYYRLLDCGFRIPPTAGSASGVLPNPVGYNRVHVQIAGEFSYQAWWEGLAAGRSFVSNGPMLLVEANGKPPGEVFRAHGGAAVEVSLDVRVAGNDPLEAVEVVRDGQVVERLTPGDARERLLPVPLPPLRFERSGWFLVRAIARVPHTFRFASSAPFYVEAGARPRRIDPEDVRFFLAWIEERIADLRAGKAEKLTDAGELEAVLAPHLEAQRVFTALLREAE